MCFSYISSLNLHKTFKVDDIISGFSQETKVKWFACGYIIDKG